MAVPPIDWIERTTCSWLVLNLCPHTAIIGCTPRARAASASRRHADAPMPLLPPLTKALIAHSYSRDQLGKHIHGLPKAGPLLTGTWKRTPSASLDRHGRCAAARS